MENKEVKDFKYLGIITGIFVCALVLLPSLNAKFISIGTRYMVAGALVFPITFLVNDIVTEVYGYQRSRKVIWTGFGCLIFATLMYFVTIKLPYPEFWQNQSAFETIFSATPRLALASLIAFFVGEYTNSLVLSKMKFRHGGKKGFFQGLRFIISTMAGEAVDSITFALVALAGVIPFKSIVITCITIWVFKVLWEVVALPLSIPLSNRLKKKEGIDHIDHPERTSYNPFKI